MRQRIISPSFFVDEGLVTVSPMARLLFAGLWCVADREGRLEDRPMRLKMLLFPCDECDVDGLLDELASIGVIIRYKVDGAPLIQVDNFTKHQHPHHRETPSALPPCVGDKPEETVDAMDESPRQALCEPCTSPSVYGLRNTDKDTCSSSDERFASFWASYPRRVGKGAAQKAWKKLKADEQSAAIAVLADFPFDTRDDGKYIPHPATWLNARRWEDEFEAERVLPDEW